MKRRVMEWVVGFVVVYVAVCTFLYGAQRNLMYFPGGARPAVERLTGDIPETLSIPVTDEIIFDLWYWPAREGFETLVFFHGNGQAYQFWVDKLMLYRRLGYGVFFTDYRGYGGFAGAPSEANNIHDARTFLKALHEERGVPYDEMIFYGESLGTGVAVQMAAEFQPKAVILESAYSATSDVAKSRHWMFPVDLLMIDQYRSIDYIADLQMPKLFVHGGRDSIIPLRFGQRLYEAAPEPKAFKVIAKAGHNDLYDHDTDAHIAAFLSSITARE